MRGEITSGGYKMKTLKSRKILAVALTLVMAISMVIVFAVFGSANTNGSTYTLNAGDLTPFAAGIAS